MCIVEVWISKEAVGREPEDLFEELLQEKCDKGIEIYQAQFLRCALEMEDGTTCVNYAHNHAMQHCSEKNLIWNGPIDKSGFAKAKSDVVLAIKRSFIAMYTELYAVSRNQTRPMLHHISRYRRVILGHTRRKPLMPDIVRVGTIKEADFAYRNDVWVSAKSNMSCFACLQYGPDHILPCGHGFCEECVKDFGTISLQQPYHYKFVECILCGTTEGQWLEQLQPSAALASSELSQQPPNPQPSVPQVVRLNPRCSGVRVLTLDGGGIKGIVELAILEIIEQRVGLKVPIRDLFDLIVGTSTGMAYFDRENGIWLTNGRWHYFSCSNNGAQGHDRSADPPTVSCTREGDFRERPIQRSMVFGSFRGVGPIDDRGYRHVPSICTQPL